MAHGSASCGLIWLGRIWTDTEGEDYGGREKHCCNFDDRGTDYDAMVAEEARRMIQDSGGGTDEQH